MFYLIIQIPQGVLVDERLKSFSIKKAATIIQIFTRDAIALGLASGSRKNSLSPSTGKTNAPSLSGIRANSNAQRVDLPNGET